MTENEFLLEDRIIKIKSINEKYNLLDNAYISFSGGKDSTVLSYLIDEALPQNKIPRVFFNTGIEYKMIVDFVKEFQKSDDRVVIYNVGKNIKKTLDEVGYPFKSKEHSQKVYEYTHYKKCGKSILKYFGLIEGDAYRPCPEKLKYQITNDFKLKISHFCCNEFKKKPSKDYMKNSGKFITITGMMKSEGGERTSLNCISTNKNSKRIKFNPMSVLTKQWEDWFIAKKNIKLCELYYPPFNFERTGCKGCPYNPKLDNDLLALKILLPNEASQCEFIWKPVYEEYRRIGYRLKPKGLFD